MPHREDLVTWLLLAFVVGIALGFGRGLGSDLYGWLVG